jgi:glycosyltransferase involved in cell wall biosynthesis
MSLRVSRVLRELSKDWSIVLICPPTGDSAAANGVELAAEITFPNVSQWMYVPSQYETAPVVKTVQNAVRSYEPAVALLWGGMEYLRSRIPEMPPSISDRVDSMTLSSWRLVLGSSGWTEFRRRLAHLAYVARYEFTTRRLSRAMVVVGEADANVLRRFLRVKNVHVIPNGVDVAGSAIRTRSSRPTVMFTGVLSYGPNIDAVRYFVDEVWPEIRRQLPDAVFQVVGRNPTPEINALSSLPGIEIFPDVASVADLLAEAWVAVAPMRTGCGIKNKILEAWSVATPVAMTPIATNGLTHAPSELLLAAEGHELSSLILDLLNDPAKRQRLGALAQSTAVEKFSWRETGESLNALLADVVGSAAAGRES